MARLTRDPRDLRTKKSTAKRSRANVWFVKSYQGNLIERSQNVWQLIFPLSSVIPLLSSITARGADTEFLSFWRVQ